MKLGRYILLIVLLFCSTSAKSDNDRFGRLDGTVRVTFTESVPPCRIYVVEQKNNNSWVSVASGNNSPIVFKVNNVVPGTYIFRLRGQTAALRPLTLLSNEFTFVIPNPEQPRRR